MKIALFADLHPLGERLEEFTRQWEVCLQETDRFGCTHMLIAGDIYDASNLADAHASAGAIFEAVTDPLGRWLRARVGRQILAITGNHDKASDAETDALTTLEALGSNEEINVIREPEWFVFGDFGHEVAVLCVPWSWTPGDAEAVVRNMLDTCPEGATCKILMAHAQVQGGRMGKGETCPGGPWCFSREFLDEMSREFDLVHLGDFHAEQEYAPNVFHNGALWQKDTGEEGNRQGFAVFDTVTKVRTPVEVNASPMFRTEIATSPEMVTAIAATHRPGVERLRIITDGFDLGRADKLPLVEAGIRVSPRNMPKAERVARVIDAVPSGKLHDADVLAMFVASRDGAIDGAEHDAMRVLLDEVIAANPKALSKRSSALGCVTPIRTRIEGVGRHMRAAEIDWSKTGPLVSVFGENGAGKTSALGALPLAIWNAMPGYPGGIGDNLCVAGDGRAEAEAEFSCGGTVYRMTRTFGSSHRAWLREWKGGEWVDVAGPKVSEVEKKVEGSLFGTIDLAHSTWLVTADRDNDLCASAATSDDRRKAFGAYLDFARMNAIAEACGDTAKTAEAEAKTLAAQLADLPDYAGQKEAAEVELAEARAIEPARQRELADAKESLAAAEEELRNAKGDDTKLTHAIKLHESAKKAVAECRTKVAAIEAEVDSLTKRVAELAATEADVKALGGLRMELAGLEEKETAWRTFDGWKRTEETLASKVTTAASNAATAESNVATAASNLEAVRARAGISAEDETLASKLDERIASGKKAAAENKAAEERNAAQDRERQEIKSRRTGIDRELKQIEARLAGKKPHPLGQECEKAACHFIAEFLALPDRVNALGAEDKDLAARLEAIPANEAVKDLTPLYAAHAEAKSAQDRVTAAKAAQGEIDAAVAKHAAALAARGKIDSATLKAAEKALADHRAVAPIEEIDPTPRLREVRASIDKIAGAPQKLEAIKRDESTLHVKQDELAEARARLESEVSAEGKARGPAESAALALKNRDEGIAATQRKVELAKERVGTAENQVTANRSLQATLEERTRGYETRIAEVARRREACSEVELRAARLRTLQIAFGKKGAQPILIDAAAPELEDIANELLAEATDGEQTLRIVTQEKGKDGDIREVFLVLVSDDRGERDIARFSGGEREKVQFVFRAALSIWIARRMGTACETLIIDEAFNKLTAKNQRVMFSVLPRLVRHFAKIIIVTPNAELARLFPSQVIIKERFDGCAVEYVGCREVERSFDHVANDGAVTPDMFGAEVEAL